MKNFHVSVKEVQDKVIFLRKMLAGGSEHSFGIHVAQMAGMPEAIVKRSKEILVQLESQRESMEKRGHCFRQFAYFTTGAAKAFRV